MLFAFENWSATCYGRKLVKPFGDWPPRFWTDHCWNIPVLRHVRFRDAYSDGRRFRLWQLSMTLRAMPGYFQAETTVEDARGASVIVWAVRAARMFNLMTPEEPEKLGIAEDERPLHVRVANGKANMVR